MQRLLVISAVGAALFIGAGSARAATLVYGFNDPTINGFSVTYDGSDAGTASATESTTTGVTEGTGALDIDTGTASGYDQTDVGTQLVPSALSAPGTTSFNIDLTFNPNGVAYSSISPIFFLEGNGVDQKLSPASSATGENTNLASLNYVGTTLTYNLAAYKDPYGASDGDGTTALYTPGQIAAAVDAANPASGAAITSFAFEVVNGATTSTGPLNYYIDNFTVPSAVPEPASLGVISLGGLLLARRRRSV